jgi:hydroxymethylglutaryl-CoA reductase (NADPH)
LLLKEEKDPERILDLEALLDVALTLEHEASTIRVPKTIVHNDYSPRNIAIRDDGQLLVYDWELAVLNYSHRDIVELLSFVLPQDFTEEQLIAYLRYHYQSQADLGITWEDWLPVYTYALKEFLVTRVAFYEVAGIIVKYDFSAHILYNALKMLKLLRHV